MTFTSDERREIAARLAMEAQAWRETFPDYALKPVDASEVMQDILEFVGLHGKVLCCDIFQRLADLIDRPTCHDIASHGEMQPAGAIQWFECSECHCKAQTGKIGMALHFCPHCGAEVE